MDLQPQPEAKNFIATLSPAEVAQVNAVVGGRDIYDAVLPNVNWSRFGYEQFINLNYAHPDFANVHVADSDFGPNSLGKQEIRLTRSGQQLFSYVLDEVTLECGLRFDSPPSFTGITELRFRITQADGLKWYEQGALSQAEIDEGCFRPDNVVGSIAIYAGIGDLVPGIYGPRKIAHLFRWSCIDNAGQMAWCDALYVDGEELVIGLPVDWMNDPARVYPVQAMGHGDTFGATGSGATLYGPAANRQFATYMGAAPEDGTVDSVSAWIRPEGYSWTFGYFEDTGATLPGTLLGDSAGGIPAGGSVKTYVTQDLDAGVPITAGDEVWAGANRLGGYFYYDDTPGNTWVYWTGFAYVEGTLQSYSSPGGPGDRQFAFHLNYTPAAGGALSPDNLTQAQSIDSPGIVEAAAMSPADLDQVQTLDAVTVIQAHVVTPASLQQSQSIDITSLLQAHVMTPNGLQQLQTLDGAGITEAAAISPADIDQAQTIDSPAISEAGTLDPAAVTQSQTLGVSGIVQAHVLVVDDLMQSQSISVPALVLSGVLSPADVMQAQGIDAAILVQAHVMSPASMQQAQSIESLTLTLVLMPADLMQGHTLQAVVIDQASTISPADLEQLQALDAAALSSAYLQPNGLTQGQTISFRFVIPDGSVLLLANNTRELQLEDGTVINLLADATTKIKVH